ncbi:MAG: adenylyltransferase/cytidyltransferase family protein [Alphaproteobacteria bacterium]|nr:adenylyltransferase/cytidyltransferase family protein [Alphaproteobacteria bacterium]
MENTAIYFGSFDPFTKGHLAIVCKALCVFDNVIIAVGKNPDKTCLFTVDERLKLIKSSITDFYTQYRYRYLNNYHFTASEQLAATKIGAFLENDTNIKIIAYDGLSVDTAIRHQASAIIRGERIVGDHEAEMQLSQINQDLLNIRNSPITQMLIPVPSGELTYVSSSNVKKLCEIGEYIAAMKYVMPSVHKKLMEHYLLARYIKLFSCDTAKTAKDHCFDWSAISAKYQKHSYHNLSHLAYCFNLVDALFKKNLSPQEIYILDVAIFFHDLYCHGGDTDEQLSAFEACDFIEHFGNNKDKYVVKQLILSTSHSYQMPTGADNLLIKLAQIIHDVDYAILCDAENYGLYAQNLRVEYSHYNTATYAKNRINFINNVLSRECIFETGHFQKLEENAYSNLKNERVFWESRT